VENETYVYPYRAKQKLKNAKMSNVPVYIFGMSGFGKSALIEHFFEKKKYIYFDARSTSLEVLDEVAKSRDIQFVLDNVQSIDSEYVKEKLCELMRRKDVWMIFLSRCQCPDWMLSEYLKYTNLVTITEEDLSLDDQETQEYMYNHGLTSMTEEDLMEIYKVSRGQGLFLHILLNQMIQQGYIEKKEYVYNADVLAASQNVLYDYIEKNVYNNWSNELTKFVMEVSIVDRFTKELASEITGIEYVDKYIHLAMENGNFLRMEDGIYSLEQSVMLSMRRRMKIVYPKPKINELFYNAGHYYRRKGQVAEALDMFRRCGNQGQISEILVENAKRNPATGFIYELRDYYLRMSEDQVQEHVELMACMSMLQSILMHPEESDYWYEKLEERAETANFKEKRQIRNWLAYLDIGLPHRGSDNLKELISSASKLIISRSISLPEFSVTSNLPTHMNGGKDFCEWSKKDKDLAKTIGKAITLVLGKNGHGLIDLALAESYMEKGESDYEVMRLISLGQLAAQTKGKPETCYVAIGLSAWMHIINGHIEDARTVLSEFRTQMIREKMDALVPDVERFLCQVSLYRGEKTEIDNWMETAPNENEEFFCMYRMRYLLKVRIYMYYGKYNQAFMLLQKIRYYAETVHRTFVSMECDLLESILEFRMGNPNYVERFQKLLERAEEYHFVRIFTREGAALQKLLKAQKWTVKDEAYLRQINKEVDSVAKAYPGYLNETSGTDEIINGNALSILRYQAEGMSYEEISAELGISKTTVKYHCTENYRKLGVNGKAAAIAEARKRHLI